MIKHKPSEKSVFNSHQLSKLIVEEEYISDSTSNMSLDAKNADLPKFSMVFNMRLTFVKTNNHGTQLFQDPINH